MYVEQCYSDSGAFPWCLNKLGYSKCCKDINKRSLRQISILYTSYEISTWVVKSVFRLELRQGHVITHINSCSIINQPLHNFTKRRFSYTAVKFRWVWVRNCILKNIMGCNHLSSSYSKMKYINEIAANDFQMSAHNASTILCQATHHT